MARPSARKWALILTVFAAVVIAVPTAVWASHRFTDVPDSNTFHNAIDWMAENGITVGCNPPDNDEYCPSENVTRGQMAAFMKRLAESQVVEAKSGGTAFEAVNDAEVILTGTTPGTANSIATLDGLAAGSYVAMATWAGVADDDQGGRIVCDLSVGSASSRARAIVSDSAGLSGEDSMAAVVAGTLGSGGEVNLSCWREGGTLGNLSVLRTNVVVTPVGAVQSVNVDS